MTDLEVLDSPRTYVNLINVYRKNKATAHLNGSYNYINFKAQEEQITQGKTDETLIPTALVISCGYSIDMLGGDHNFLKPYRGR